MKQEERARRTREKITAAAVKEFGSRCYEGGTMGSICRSGINKGLIYHYFDGKDALYLWCVETSRDLLLTSIRDAMEGHPDISGTESVSLMIETRVNFGKSHPMESHILFQALMDPPGHLKDRITLLLAPLQEENLKVCRKMLSQLHLRDGITAEQGEQYFLMMQQMFNEYFSSPALRDKSMEDRIALHEKRIPEFLEIMIYGIADKQSNETP